MSNQKQNNRFQGDAWFEKKLNTRVREALKDKEALFARQHRNDSVDQLLEYVHQFAKELGHTPNACEMIGGSFIQQRVGDWLQVVLLAGLPWPRKAPPMDARLIYKQEYKRQAALLRQERTELRKARDISQQQKAADRNKQKQELLERDMEWGREHEEDTDEQLLEYLRRCAAELGHSPVCREVVGGNYIAKRFVTWPVALTLADLELPKGIWIFAINAEINRRNKD